MEDIYDDCEVSEDDTKYCVYCKEEIETDEFYIDECNTNTNGDVYICADCIKEYADEQWGNLDISEKISHLCIRENKEVRMNWKF